MGAGLRRRALLLLVLLLAALSGTAATSGAADGDLSPRLDKCFGQPGTIWATATADVSQATKGTKGNDVIIGSAGNDIIFGRAGDDLICGNGGHDMIFGQRGRDRIRGGPGNDILYGDEGRDTLLGGPGGNILNAGLSTDHCLSGDTYVSCELPSVDQILAECPTTREIARIDAEFDLVFDANPTAGQIACTSAQGSAYLSPLQKRAYNAVRIMGRISFDAALPWTPYTLEDWFAQNITTIRFRDDIAYSQYGPAGVISIQTGWPLPAGQATDRFIAPGGVVGLGDLMVLMVHEARHAEKLHNCEWKDGIGFVHDQTIAELGAWGVQYYLHLWLADHTSQAFLRPLTGDPGDYQAQHRQDATIIHNTRFCNEP